VIFVLNYESRGKKVSSIENMCVFPNHRVNVMRDITALIGKKSLSYMKKIFLNISKWFSVREELCFFLFTFMVIFFKLILFPKVDTDRTESHSGLMRPADRNLLRPSVEDVTYSPSSYRPLNLTIMSSQTFKSVSDITNRYTSLMPLYCTDECQKPVSGIYCVNIEVFKTPW
jgi:hypothetical protein